MSEPVKAQRAIVRIGAIEIDGFMLPDSSYRMSLSQTGECVGKVAQGVSNFLRSKTLKTLLGEGGGISNFLPKDVVESLLREDYTPDLFLVDVGEEGTQGQTRIRGLPLEIVSLYWQWESYRGNKKALVLTTGLALESLFRRFDNAFGISRTESEHNDRLIAYTRHLEASLEKLGEAYAVEDDIRRENEFFKQRFKDLGIDPYALPGNDFDPRGDE